MTNTEEKFLHIFKVHKVTRDAILMPQTLTIEIEKWEAASRLAAGDAYESLAEKGLVTFTDGKYRLLDKGYEYIYRDYNIEQTKAIILNLFRKADLKAGQLLPNGSLMVIRPKQDAYHQDNFVIALNGLVSDGLIEQDTKGYRLTTEGFSEIN